MIRTIELRYPLWLRLLTAALIAAPLGAAWFTWLDPAGAAVTAKAPWRGLVPWMFLLAWMSLSYQVFLVRVVFDNDGVTYETPYRTLRLKWRDVRGFFYVHGLDGYFLESYDGDRIWLNNWREGFGFFVEVAVAKLGLKPQPSALGNRNDEPAE